MINSLDSYNRLWACLRPVVPLYLSWRSLCGKEDSSKRGQRLAKSWQNQRPEGVLIWLHAVSVGETVAAISLARACLDQLPSSHILITTNTMAALNRLEQIQPDRCFSCYQPLDDRDCVTRFLAFWRPDAAVFLESDFWPNLIIQTAQAGIPVTFASSQLSDKAFANWQKRPKLAAQMFGSADLICAVDTAQQQKFDKLCTAPEVRKPRIKILGSLKLSAASLAVDPAFSAELKTAAAGRPVLLAASTHAPEEELITATSHQLTAAGYEHLLVIAPRHRERGDDIARLIPTARRRSKSEPPQSDDSMFLADSLGEMGSLITAADIVILGGSFTPKGGHNPLEIAALGKPVITGPSQFKNQAEFDTLHAIGQSVTASDRDELCQHLTRLLDKLKSGEDVLDQTVLSQASAYVAEACERPAKTAQLIIDGLRLDTPQTDKK